MRPKARLTSDVSLQDSPASSAALKTICNDLDSSRLRLPIRHLRPKTKTLTYRVGDLSVLIYFGGLLLGGGANKTTNTLRTGLVISYCLGWLRPSETRLRPSGPSRRPCRLPAIPGRA
jgi:hypothetical protein